MEVWGRGCVTVCICLTTAFISTSVWTQNTHYCATREWRNRLELSHRDIQHLKSFSAVVSHMVKYDHSLMQCSNWDSLFGTSTLGCLHSEGDHDFYKILSVLFTASGLYLHNPYPHNIHTNFFHSGCTCQMGLPHAKLQWKLFYQLFRSFMGLCFVCIGGADLFAAPGLCAWAECRVIGAEKGRLS